MSFMNQILKDELRCSRQFSYSKCYRIVIKNYADSAKKVAVETGHTESLTELSQICAETEEELSRLRKMLAKGQYKVATFNDVADWLSRMAAEAEGYFKATLTGSMDTFEATVAERYEQLRTARELA